LLAGLATGAVVNTYVAKKLGIDMGSVIDENASNLANVGYSMAGGASGALLNNNVGTTPNLADAPINDSNNEISADHSLDLGQTLGLGQSGFELPE
jgi:hypothetical protein